MCVAYWRTLTADGEVREARRASPDVLILIIPSLLNYVVALYLILVGVIGLNDIYHFIN